MATIKEPIRQDQSNHGAHNAPIFADHKPTGLREAAIADINTRLIVGKVAVDENNSRPPVRPL